MNKIHTLNIKLSEQEYAALRRLKSSMQLPFTTIVKTLVLEADSNPRHTLAQSVPSPLEDKLQYQLKLLEAREAIREARDAKREAARLIREEQREEKRKANRLAKIKEKADSEAERRMLKACKKGEFGAGLTPEALALFNATMQKERREEQERKQR
jgi:hypothetical protein